MENESSTSHQGKKIEVYIIGDSLKQNGELSKALKNFHLPVTYSSDGRGLLNPARRITPVYVMEEFEGDTFTSLEKSGQRVLGPTIVMQCAQQNGDLPSKNRPLYSTSMRNVVLTFTGFRSKDEVTRLYNLARYMCATIRKDFSLTKNTHLVATANAVFGEKYKFAATGGIPIMTKDWIYQAWAQRHDVNSKATDRELMQFKLLPFVGCKMAFLGYSPEEQQHMEEVSNKNGGEVVQPKEPSCTHIVVEDKTFIFWSEYNRKVNILKNEWFWACLQIEAKAEERIYVYENPNSVCISSSVVMPEKGSKREKLESIAQQLAVESLEHDFYSAIPDFYKIDDRTLVAESFQDILSTDSTDGNSTLKSPPLNIHTLTPRQQISLELFQTECNYVAILHTIMTLFKEQIEKPNQVGGPLLSPTEIKIIFGNLPPIYEVHLKIQEGLAEIIQKRKEHGIGNIILKHAFELLRSYPPFVNFFEKSKEVLAICNATKPRFHAFLKRCQNKPECGRQTLQELLIRPVQRLPSIILLLNDLLKHTTKGTIDYQVLERSIQAIKDVLKHINEDKRKTEGQIAMFDTVNDIENCPPNLLSSHRTLISKTDVLELTDLLSNKGSAMTLLLFTDVLEICRKKNKVSDSRKDVRKSFIINPGSSAVKDTTKSFKHIELISLSHVKRVVDINETRDCENAFAIVFWSNKELKELLYAFQLDNDSKSALLRTLCRQIAYSLCKTEAESLLTTLEPEQLGLVGPQNDSNILSKALKKTQSKLGSSWSLKSSSKLSLSKAISTIFDPLRNFGGPSNKMAAMKVPSFNDLTVLEPSCSTTKSSPVRRKKRKSSSFGAFPTNV